MVQTVPTLDKRGADERGADERGGAADLPSKIPPRRVGLLIDLNFGEAEYQVPTRFGIGAILGMLTVFALLFGGFRWFSAPASYYYFVATLGLLVCFAQIVWGGVPRSASLWAGTVFLPLWSIGYLLLTGELMTGESFAAVLIGIPCFAIAGAAVGYAVGTLAAGCFMAADVIESALLARRDVAVDPSRAAPRADFPASGPAADAPEWNEAERGEAETNAPVWCEPLACEEKKDD